MEKRKSHAFLSLGQRKWVCRIGGQQAGREGRLRKNAGFQSLPKKEIKINILREDLGPEPYGRLSGTSHIGLEIEIEMAMNKVGEVHIGIGHNGYGPVEGVYIVTSLLSLTFSHPCCLLHDAQVRKAPSLSLQTAFIHMFILMLQSLVFILVRNRERVE